MPDRSLTFVVVAEGNRPVRQYRVTRTAIRIAIGGALLLLVASGGLAARALLPPAKDPAARRLERQNVALVQELDTLQQRVDILQESLAGLEKRDELYRLLAGLEPLDAEVRMVGIGGPGDPAVEDTRLWDHDRRIARRAFETSNQLSELLRRARLLAFSWREAEDTLQFKHQRLASTPSISPTAGYMTSGFTSSRWHPILDKPRPHNGLDIVAAVGTPIHAAGRGTVRWAGPQDGYGLTVEIDHGFGIVTRYAHASRVLVRKGQKVERGEPIARVGQTGLTVGPHLHYEVLVNGRHADPRGFILESKVIPD
jgi:murein DD-endopeptidase MepM/ murein hydrolase activator NlpD